MKTEAKIKAKAGSSILALDFLTSQQVSYTQMNDEVEQVEKVVSDDQEEVAYPLACQESSNSGSKNIATGTSEAYEEDDVANEGGNPNNLIHGGSQQLSIAEYNNFRSTFMSPIEEEKVAAPQNDAFHQPSPILSQEESGSKTGDSEEAAMLIMQSSNYQNRTTLSLLQ